MTRDYIYDVLKHHAKRVLKDNGINGKMKALEFPDTKSIIMEVNKVKYKFELIDPYEYNYQWSHYELYNYKTKKVIKGVIQL